MTKPQTTNIQDRAVEIAGTKLNMRFSVLAVEALREHWNLERDEGVFQKLQDLTQLRDIMALIWACTVSNHPELSYKEVVRMLDQDGIENLQQVAQQLVAGSLPQADPDKPVNPS